MSSLVLGVRGSLVSHQRQRLWVSLCIFTFYSSVFYHKRGKRPSSRTHTPPPLLCLKPRLQDGMYESETFPPEKSRRENK